MATPTIKIDQSGLAAGVAGQSRQDLKLGVSVTLTDPANPGALSYAWVMLSRPVGSTATLSGASSSTASFTPDVHGTYLIELTVNGTDRSFDVVTHESSQGGCRVIHPNGTIVPGEGETNQFSGWEGAMATNLRKLDRLAWLDLEMTDLAGLNAAMEAAVQADGSGRIVYLPRGTISINDTFHIRARRNFTFRGEGRESTIILPTFTDATKPAIKINACQETGFEDLTVRFTGTALGESCVQIVDDNPNPGGVLGSTYVASQRSSRNFLRRVMLDCSGAAAPGTPAKAAYGLLVKIGTFGDGKNDHHLIEIPWIRGYSEAGISIRGQSARNITIISPLIQSRGVGKYGITTAEVPGSGGGYCVVDGVIMENLNYAVDLGDRSGPISFLHTWFEQDARLLRSLDQRYTGLGAQAEFFPITLDGIRFATDPLLHPADNKIILIEHCGPFRLTGSIGTGTEDDEYRIHLEPRFPYGDFEFRCSMQTTGKPHRVFTGWTPPAAEMIFGQDNTLANTKLFPPLDDGGLVVPYRQADWTNRGVLVPRAWWLFQEDTINPAWAPTTAYTAGQKVTNANRSYVCATSGTSAGSGGPTLLTDGQVDGTCAWNYLYEGKGRVFDLQTRSPKANLAIRGAASLQNTVGGYDGALAGLTEVADQQFSIEDSGNLFSPLTQSVAWLVDFQVTSLGAANRVLLIAGGVTNPLYLRFTSDGKMQLLCGPNTATGTYAYNDSARHRALLVYNRTTKEVWVYTDKETIGGPEFYSTTIDSISRKGFGSNTATTPFGGWIRMGAVWLGPDAEAQDLRTLARLGQTVYDDTLATDGPGAVVVAATRKQWEEVDLPAPDAWWLMQAAASPEPDRGPSDLPLTATGSLDFQQTLAGWTGKFIRLTETANERMTFGTNFNPALDSAAALVVGRVGAVSGTRTLLGLGTITSDAAASGCQLIQFDSGGHVVLNVDGVSKAGSYVYESDGIEHPFLIVHNFTRKTIRLITDQEVIEGTYSNTITNGTKGIGAAGGLTPPEFWAREVAWWYGDKAEEIDALGLEALTLLRWLPELQLNQPMDTGAVHGLTVSWVSASQVQIAAGSCRSSDDTFDIDVTSAQTVAITSSGANGLDTGAEASSTWYAIHVIGDSTGTNPGRGLLVAGTAAPVLPSGYDKSQRLGWVRNNGSSNFLDFEQRGSGKVRTYWYKEARSVLLALNAQGNASFTDVDLTAWVPPTCDHSHLLVALTTNGGTSAAGDGVELRPNGSGASDGPFRLNVPVTAQLVYGTTQMPTDSGRIIEYRTTSADDDASIWVLGFDHEI